jgi:hypothetical protein
MRYLIINKGSMEVYERAYITDVAFIVGVPGFDISRSLKRTGRWDREDGVITVIYNQPVDSSV